MKVDGKAFKRARQEIRKDSPRRGKPGCPARGTQEWLADTALVLDDVGKWKSLSVRTIQALEKGEASIETVDAVSPHLEINGRELIVGYGKEHIICKAKGLVDFRPAVYPLDNTQSFRQSPLMLTIDPLTVQLEAIDINHFTLEKVEASIYFSGLSYDFEWLYKVSLNPNGEGWLGIVDELQPFDIVIEKTKEEINIPVMLGSSSIEKLTWDDFVTSIYNTSSLQAEIIIKVNFSSFYKEIKTFFSIELLKLIFENGKSKRKSEIPYRASIHLIS